MTPSRTRIDWRPILLEAAFVVLGVVLALAANELRQQHLDRRDAATALRSIREEVVANRGAVAEAARYHAQLTDTLTKLTRAGAAGGADAPSSASMSRLFNRGFFHPATLLHTAWDAAAATDAVRHMRYHDVLQLAQIYEFQEGYRRQSENVGQLIYAQLYAQGFDGVAANYANFTSILAAFWYRECQLLHRYDELLAQLDPGAIPAAGEIPQQCSHVPDG